MIKSSVPTLDDLARYPSYREMVAFVNSLHPLKVEEIMREYLQTNPRVTLGNHTSFQDKKPIEHTTNMYTKTIGRGTFDIEINMSFCVKCSNVTTLTVIGYEHRLGESYTWQIKSRGKYI